METIALFTMAFICLAFLVYLKQKADREMLKDVLELRMQVKGVEHMLHSALSSNNEVVNKFLSSFEQTNLILREVKESANDANIATQTILKEYELNGTPMGYIRKEEHVDMFEGI